jgi:DNA-binding CsgD family transcriptional regulator
MGVTPGRLLIETASVTDATTALLKVGEALRASVGAGPMFVATADPRTGDFASTSLLDIPAAAAAQFFANELTGSDVVPFRELVDAAAPVASLFGATADRPQTSARWRDTINPLGWGDELRAVVRANGSTWGYLCLHREAGERPFDDKDMGRLSLLLPAVAGLLRRVTLRVKTEASPLGSGVVLTAPNGAIIGTSGAATEWISEFGTLLPSGLPIPIAALVHAVTDSRRPITRVVTTLSGRRGVIEAAPLEGIPQPQVAVVITDASPELSLDLFSLAAALTAREQQVVAAVIRGLSTTDIAGELYISVHTVQAHLTSVFAKTGVRSRRELIRRIGR